MAQECYDYKAAGGCHVHSGAWEQPATVTGPSMALGGGDYRCTVHYNPYNPYIRKERLVWSYSHALTYIIVLPGETGIT